MATTVEHLRREMIRSTLEQRAGGNADAKAIAEATIGIWQQISVRLVRVIGARGFDALLFRSLHLTSRIFPKLSISADQRDRVTLLACLRTCLETSEKPVSAEISYVLLVTFTELLTTLIGESLTERLLQPVWVTPPAESDREAVS